MSDTFNIEPATEIMVRDPENAQPLKEGGEEKPRSTYWLRRLNEGLVREVENPDHNKSSEEIVYVDGEPINDYTIKQLKELAGEIDCDVSECKKKAEYIEAIGEYAAQHGEPANTETADAVNGEGDQK